MKYSAAVDITDAWVELPRITGGEQVLFQLLGTWQQSTLNTSVVIPRVGGFLPLVDVTHHQCMYAFMYLSLLNAISTIRGSAQHRQKKKKRQSPIPH